MRDFALFGPFAQSTADRLKAVKQDFQVALLYGGDGGHFRRLLIQRHPKITIDCIENRIAFIEAEKQAYQSTQPFWQRFKPLAVMDALNRQPEKTYDLLYAPFRLPADDYANIFQTWRSVLQTNGMLFFHTLGIGSCPELEMENLSCLPDMHDLGDALLRSGFADSVMDRMPYHLSYQTPEIFWQDMNDLGIDTLLLANRSSIDERILSGSLKKITIEVIFGHAIAPEIKDLASNEHIITFHPQGSLKK
ncbi:MAG: hypothetical protein IJR44_05305 [Neisseriaceae bacterium]|nr:hypothetical protein [Neisseriaceae bacterium]